MSYKSKKIFIFEFFPFHAHNLCLHPHLMKMIFADTEFELRYFLNPTLFKENTYIPKKHSATCIASTKTMHVLRKLKLLKIWLIIKFYFYVKISRPDIIIFNSLENGISLELFRLLAKTHKIALVHNPENIALEKDKYSIQLSMNKYIYEHFRSKLDGYCLSFYGTETKPNRIKKNDTFTIGVPGSISFSRRNYELLVDIAKKLSLSTHKHHKVIFNIIGGINEKDGPKLQSLINKLDIREYFIFHAKVSDEEFIQAIYESDALIPLITEKNSPYFSIKNSATYSHSARYTKPMIIPRENADAWHIPYDCCITYEKCDDLVEKLLTIKDDIPNITANYQTLIEKMLWENQNHLLNVVKSKKFASH